MGRRILIFGGTTEGRVLAEKYAAEGVICEVSVVTEYGASLLPKGVGVHVGRLDREQMTALIRQGFTEVEDATHPYAAEATENIKGACGAAGVPYRCIERERSEAVGIKAGSVGEIVELLNGSRGAVLSTLGSKSLGELAAVEDCFERVWVRVLPREGILTRCQELGFDPAKVICEKGPFTVEQNIAHLKQSGAAFLLTKESGKTGGYPEKITAARIVGTTVITLMRNNNEDNIVVSG